MISIPVQLAFGTTAAYNAVVFLSFILAAYFAYLLVAHVSGSRLAGVVGGVIYAFGSYHMTHLLGHTNLLSSGWLPAYALCLLRATETTGRRRTLLAGAAGGALVLLMLVDWQWSSPSSSPPSTSPTRRSPGARSCRPSRRRDRRRLARPRAAAARADRRADPQRRDPTPRPVGRPDLLRRPAQLRPPEPAAPLVGGLGRADAGGLHRPTRRGRDLPGVSPAGAGRARPLVGSPPRRALGARGDGLLPARARPGLARQRPLALRRQRLVGPAALRRPPAAARAQRRPRAAAVQRHAHPLPGRPRRAGAGPARAALPRLGGGRARLALAPVLLAGLLVEHLALPYQMERVQAPAFYRQLAGSPEAGTILEWPFSLRRARSNYYQTVHGRPIVGGYVARRMHYPCASCRRSAACPSAGRDRLEVEPANLGAWALDYSGVRWIVVYPDDPRLDRQGLPQFLGRYAEPTPVYQDGETVVYRPRPPGAPTSFLALGRGGTTSKSGPPASRRRAGSAPPPRSTPGRSDPRRGPTPCASTPGRTTSRAACRSSWTAARSGSGGSSTPSGSTCRSP